MISILSLFILILILVIGGFSLNRFYKNGFVPAKYINSGSKKTVKHPEKQKQVKSGKDVAWIKEYYESLYTSDSV